MLFDSVGVIIVISLTEFGNHVVEGALATGPCQDATPGQTYETCEMSCTSGSCTETLATDSCPCSGYATFTSGDDNYELKYIYITQIK